MSSDPLALYRHRLVATGYDVLNAVLWWPTGSDRLRRDLVTSLDVGPDDRVLELGCGTGLVTRHLCATGAEVVAVDRAPAMAAAAHRRAPAARYLGGDVRRVEVPGAFSAVVVAFLLHELDPGSRIEVLTRAVAALHPDGRIGVLEWGCPPGRWRARAWRATVRTIEPAVAHDVLDTGLDEALAGAGLEVTQDQHRAGGRARIIEARPTSGDRRDRPPGPPPAPGPGTRPRSGTDGTRGPASDR